MDRGARQATIHGGAKVRHDLATKPTALKKKKKSEIDKPEYLIK